MAVTKALVQTSQSVTLPSANRVIDECLAEFGVSEEEFYGRSRIKRIVIARRYAGFILFHFCGWSFVKLSKFVNRDRTNMMHHVRVLRTELTAYRDARDSVYNILERLDLIDTSSSGNDWYYAWVHNQLKDVELYHNIIKHDAADALADIMTVTHADGRIDRNPENKLTREGHYHRMHTVAGYTALITRMKMTEDGKRAVEDYIKNERRINKFDDKTDNPYNNY